MNSVTHSLLSNDQFRDIGDEVVESTLHTARKLGQWDIKAPEANCTEHSTLFKAFQGLHFARSAAEAKENFERQLFATMGFLSGKSDSSVPARVRLRTLAALTEADDVIRTERSEYLLDTWDRMKSREKWMRAGEYVDAKPCTPWSILTHMQVRRRAPAIVLPRDTVQCAWWQPGPCRFTPGKDCHNTKHGS
jgi:ataxia telangiectasia mutated family protein